MRERSVALEQMMPLILEQLEMGNPVSFTPNGTSMRPMLEGGRDRVVLGPVPEKLKKYDLPLYRRDNGQYILHRIVHAGEVYTCMGDNQFLPEHHVRHDQILAVVTGFVRNGRTYSVHQLPYRLYCVLWCASRPARKALHLVRRIVSGP